MKGVGSGSEPENVITWNRNPLRWILFYYILGTIAACFVIFIEELVHPLNVPHIYKTLFVTLFFPCLSLSIILSRHVLCALMACGSCRYTWNGV